jgi:hypothetical protein
MKNQLSCFMVLCGLLNSFISGAQTVSSPLDSLKQKLTTSLSDYYKRYPQEKIYIHTNQNDYLTGQTIWYKAYAMAYGKPSPLSKIVYVRLSDDHGKIVKQDKLPINNSTAFGSIDIPDSLHTGWYRLRAFTAWMLNADKDAFYQQAIYIKNLHDKFSSPALPESKNSAYHVKFFPEGGSLVDATICNIAFKAIDENGLPVYVYGDVLDQNKTPVAKLVTVHDGMGSFELETYANMGYVAQVHFPDNSVQNIALPQVKKTGMSMNVNVMPADEFEVKLTYAGLQQNNMDVIIEAVQNNGASITYPVIIDRGLNIFSFKKNNFSTGILQLTVFDKSGLPLAERIVFIDNRDQIRPSITTDTLSFTPGCDNVFTIHLTDNGKRPVKANLSVAITDADMDVPPDDDICPYFLMTSELKGHVYQPAYYFKNESDTLWQQLDLVMLTNRWRSFDWDTIFNERPKPLTYAVERPQFIAGKIENYDGKDKLKIKLIISGSDSSRIMAEVEPDSSGVFKFNNYNKQGTANIYYEVVNAKNRKQPLKITFFSQDLDTVRFTDDTLYRYNAAQGVSSGRIRITTDTGLITKGVALKQVDVKAIKLTPTELLIKSHVNHLTSDNAQTLDLVNVPSAPSQTIIQYITGKFPGLIITQQYGGEVGYKYHGEDAPPAPGEGTNLLKGGGADGNALFFYLDEARVEYGDIESMPLTDVALIQFVPPPVWFAPLNGGFIGALLIYTKNFNDDKNSFNYTYTPRPSRFDQYTFNSYSVTKEFSSPDHPAAKQPEADNRSTLYWNHDLDTDNEGNIKIHFFNTDKTKKYRVVIQGMDNDGRLLYLNELIHLD